ncbi:Glutathione S-transferase S1 [Mortierella alpina]|uniref:Glutathione S-transferase S1 n=1 Tax=Mortierella alpina TaxID=64518 RepID=A0A9P6JF44_MORAP|nr:Glutathione S-transferase S1 [Mortierella alpina]
MSSLARRSFKTETSSQENTQALAASDVHYRLLYWDLSSVAATARDMLSYGRAKWSNQIPTDDEWDNGKIATPFRVLPILNIVLPDGKELFLAESIVIDHYLAKKFNLLGDNEWEECTIKAMYNNIHYLRERSFRDVSFTYADKRGVALERFLTSTLPAFIADHDFHLKANGSNGHFVGNKISLADIHLANIIDHFSHLPKGQVFTAQFRTSEAIWKVKEAVERQPDIAAWRASAECEVFVQGSINYYKCTAVPEESKAADQNAL